jgi:hypothetical protein
MVKVERSRMAEPRIVIPDNYSCIILMPYIHVEILSISITLEMTLPRLARRELS